MASRQTARADLITGALLFVLAVAVIYGAWTMDRLELREIHPLSAPGLTPGLLGIALAVASAMLIVTAGRSLEGRERAAEPAAEALPAEPGAAKRLVISAAICLVYALGLVGRMPFWVATTIFVTGFIAFFEWDRGASDSRRLRRIVWALSLGLAAGLGVSYVFSDIFLVRLP